MGKNLATAVALYGLLRLPSSRTLRAYVLHSNCDVFYGMIHMVLASHGTLRVPTVASSSVDK
jgi:hypothetical protein